MIYGHEEWMEDAECLNISNPDIFFPHQYKIYQMTMEARRYCYRCPVAKECLEYAIEKRIDEGIYGGYLPDQRRAMIRRRKRGAISERK